MDDPGTLQTAIEASLDDQLSLSELRATITDLSQHAMQLRTEHFLPKGTKYRVTMKRAPFLSVRGQVQAVHSVEPSGYQVVLDFIDLAEEDAGRLAAFLETQRRRLPTNG